MLKVITDPTTGQTVRVPAGAGLELRFRRGMSRNRWRIAEAPANLLPLAGPGEVPTQATAEESQWALRFLAFKGSAGQAEPLCLELTREDLTEPAEVRRLRVVVTD